MREVNRQVDRESGEVQSRTRVCPGAQPELPRLPACLLEAERSAGALMHRFPAQAEWVCGRSLRREHRALTEHLLRARPHGTWLSYLHFAEEKIGARRQEDMFGQYPEERDGKAEALIFPALPYASSVTSGSSVPALSLSFPQGGVGRS